jgi:hypothetical protein
MIPFFLELLLFYKIRYWRYSFRRRPVPFVVSKAIAILLIGLLVVQVVLAFTLSTEEMLQLRQLSLPKLFVAGLLLNLGWLFYFPSGCQRDIKRGKYFIYPVSGYTLNNWRIMEGLFSISSLIACNLLVVPLFARSLAYGISLPAFASVIFLLALFIYDLTMLIFERLFLLAITLLLAGLIYVFRTVFPGWHQLIQKVAPAQPATIVTVLLLLAGLVYYFDTRMLILTSVKNAPHE